MARRNGWTFALAGSVPMVLLAHAGCAGRSVSQGDESGGGAGQASNAAGARPSNGTGGNGPTSSPKPTSLVLDFSTVICAESLNNANTPEPASADFMNASCSKSFCHGRNFVVGLDLRPDEGFAQRLLDAPAMHGGIPCDDDVTLECIPASCPAPGTVKLIDSADPLASWVLTTTHMGAGDCGGRMPDDHGLTPEQDACLTAIVQATAALK